MLSVIAVVSDACANTSISPAVLALFCLSPGKRKQSLCVSGDSVDCLDGCCGNVANNTCFDENTCTHRREVYFIPTCSGIVNASLYAA